MADVLTALTSLAVSVFRERTDPSYRDPASEWLEWLWPSDPILRDAQRAALIIPTRHAGIDEVVKQVFSEADLLDLGAREGALDPMVLHAGGGARMSPTAVVAGLLTSALLQIYYLRLPLAESTFVRCVLDGFEELRRAARGEQIRVYVIMGIAGVTLRQGTHVSTPWGVLRPAPTLPADGGFHLGFQPQTTCLLAEPRLLSVKFDRAPEPTSKFDPAEAASEPARMLLPLACALASKDSTNPTVPLVSWSTVLLPFQQGLGYTMPFLPPRMKPAADISDQHTELEDWSRIIDASHTPSVDVAARRLVSACAHRMDRTDALIDAVMVWENLVGTSAEVTFRVTAALAKALEPDRPKRRGLRKSLAQVYDIRSRVVHGAAVDQSDIDQAATLAIDVAVRALRSSYKRGRDWFGLSSNERADALLLEEP